MRWNCTDELADAWIHRPLAGILARRLAPTPVTPDHLTALSCGLGVCAALYLALGHPAAAPLLVAHLVFDCADGQLARMRGPSRYGRWLDGLSDDIVGAALFLGLWARGLPAGVAAACAASLLVRAVIFDGLKALHRGAAHIPVYTPVQRWMAGPGTVPPWFLRLAGLGGVTTHHVILAVSALSGDFSFFCLYTLLLANVLVAALMAARHGAAFRAGRDCRGPAAASPRP